VLMKLLAHSVVLCPFLTFLILHSSFLTFLILTFLVSISCISHCSRVLLFLSHNECEK
jgi:hypothetical protein